LTRGKRTREQEKRTVTTHLIWAPTFLHDILRPFHFGLQGKIKLLVTTGIIQFEVGTVIQSPNKVPLPSKQEGVLQLGFECKLGAEEFQLLLEFILTDRALCR